MQIQTLNRQASMSLIRPILAEARKRLVTDRRGMTDRITPAESAKIIDEIAAKHRVHKDDLSRWLGMYPGGEA